MATRPPSSDDHGRCAQLVMEIKYCLKRVILSLQNIWHRKGINTGVDIYREISIAPLQYESRLGVVWDRT